MVNCQAKSRPRAEGTRVAVRFVCWPAPSGTIVANPRRGVQSSRHTPLCRQPGIDVQLIKSSERHMECAYYPMLPHDTAVRRPHTRSCRRRSQTLHRGSVVVRETAGIYGRHNPRDARSEPRSNPEPSIQRLLKIPTHCL